MERTIETLLDEVVELAAERDGQRPVDDDRELARRCLPTLLDQLPPRQREIVAGYYGLDGGGGQTLRAIATPAGVSREDIRHHKACALRRLARLLRQELALASEGDQETLGAALEHAQLEGRLSARTLHFLRCGLSAAVLAADGSLEAFRAELMKVDGGSVRTIKQIGPAAIAELRQALLATEV
jgi:hypothetical protein